MPINLKNIVQFCVVSFALLLVGCTDDLYRPNGDKADINKQSDIISGNFIKVKFSPNYGENFTDIKNTIATKSGSNIEAANVLEKIGAKNMVRLFPYNEEYDKLMKEFGLHLWYIVEFDKDSPKTKSVKSISSIDGIDIVEQVAPPTAPVDNYIPALDVFPSAFTKAEDKRADCNFDDPQLQYQWSYNNTGQVTGAVSGADINLFEAWKITTGTPNVIVAVIDGGIDASHPDLKDNLYVIKDKLEGYDDEDIYGYNFCRDINGKDLGKLSPHFHGTHVAGTVAAKNNNKIGVCGVAGGDGSPTSGIRMLSCQIFNDAGATPYPEKAFIYAQLRGAVIAQNSWGWDSKVGYTEGMFNDSVGRQMSLRDAINYFIKYAGCDKNGNQKEGSPMKGGVVICAAGNEHKDFNSYPAIHEDAIAVSAMAPTFKFSSFTTYGEWVDIMAPGGSGSESADPKTKILSTYPVSKGSYSYQPGTSMACPHVSGVAALVVSKFGGPGFTADSLKKQILSALRPYDIYEYNSDPFYYGKLGRGYIDAAMALRVNKQQKPESIKSGVNVAPLYKEINLNWDAVKDEDDGTAQYYDLYYSTEKLTKDNYLTKGKHVVVNALKYRFGDVVEYQLKNLEFKTHYYFAISSRDRWGFKSSDVVFADGATLENHAPVLSLEKKDPIRLTENETAENKVFVEEADGHTWTYEISNLPKGVQHFKKDNYILFNYANKVSIGEYKFTVVVKDIYGFPASIDMELITYGNHAPKFVQQLDKIFMSNSSIGTTLDLSDYIKDEDGHAITFKVDSKDYNVCITSLGQDNILSVTPINKGMTLLDVIATDEHGARLRKSVPVQVVDEELVFMVYPIPATTELNVRLNDNVQSANINVRNINGSVFIKKDVIVSEPKDRLVKLDVSNLAVGTYTLNVEANGEKYSKSFVKN